MKEIDYSWKQNSASIATATMLSNQVKDLPTWYILSVILLENVIHIKQKINC